LLAKFENVGRASPVDLCVVERPLDGWTNPGKGCQMDDGGGAKLVEDLTQLLEFANVAAVEIKIAAAAGLCEIRAFPRRAIAFI